MFIHPPRAWYKTSGASGPTAAQQAALCLCDITCAVFLPHFKGEQKVESSCPSYLIHSIESGGHGHFIMMSVLGVGEGEKHETCACDLITKTS